MQTFPREVQIMQSLGGREVALTKAPDGASSLGAGGVLPSPPEADRAEAEKLSLQ